MEALAKTIGLEAGVHPPPPFRPRCARCTDRSGQARALNSAMAFHFAARRADLRHVASDRWRSATDLGDLDGFRLTELPWQVYPSAIRAEVEAAFANARFDAVAAVRARRRRVSDLQRPRRSADSELTRQTARRNGAAAESELRRGRARPGWAIVKCMARWWPCLPWRPEPTAGRDGVAARSAPRNAYPHPSRPAPRRTQLPHHAPARSIS